MVVLNINTRLKSPSTFFLGLGLIALLTLLGTYLVETLFAAPPCVLCLYQRALYIAVIFLCIAGWCVNRTKWKSKPSVILAGLCAAVFFVGTILALYHIGIENGWWIGTAGCIAEGTEAVMLPDGYGLHLEAGSTLTYNMHFHKEPGEGSGVWTQPEVACFVEERPVTHKVTNNSIGNTGFELPPRIDDYRIGASRTLEEDIYVLTYWPHGHLRAKAARYTATYPDGRTELLLDVPAYDNGWQETYKLKQPKLLPEGTRIDVSHWYDNSAERGALYDFDPTLTPGHGPRTDDEMSLGFIGYAVELDAADEN